MSERSNLFSHPQRWIAAAAILAPISFIAATPWLRAQTEAVVYLFAGIAATVCIVASMALAILKDRKMDEWHRSAARFSSQWGWLTGASLIAFLMALPPVQDLIAHIATQLNEGTAIAREHALLIFTFSFITVVFTQTVCTMILSAVWRARMSRES